VTENKWQMNRAGILNYWYYDEAEFQFADGRLLLRGSNGSGKSVTMQSLITILLDGVKHADRLDSFGSRSRRIEDYLLGEKEISDYEERTGYLYLEYKRAQSEQYVTTGIGLHARRGASRVDFWGFLLQNGRRIGKDFFLYKEEKDSETGKSQRVPLSRKELENRIGPDGRVTTEQQEYMAMVNQHVFGFASLEKYQELMQLLIQLRSPKLSRDFKPSVIYEILNASLPALSDEDLRPLAETLENMEKTKLSIEQLGREKAAFDRLCLTYDDCNRAAAAQRSLAARDARQRQQTAGERLEKAKQGIAAANSAAEAAAKMQRELVVEEESLRQEQDDLKQNEAYKAAEEKKQVADALERQRTDYSSREQSLQEKRQRESQQEDRQAEQQRRMAEQRTELQNQLEELAVLAEEADFSQHALQQQGLQLEDAEAAEHLRLWKKAGQEYQQHLQQLRAGLAAYEQKQQLNARLELELGEANRQLDAGRQEHNKLLQLLDEARDALVKQYYEWQRLWASVLPVDREDEAQLTGALQNLFLETEWSDAAAVLERVYDGKKTAVNTDMAGQQSAGRDLQRLREMAAAELRELQATKEAELPLPDAYAAARQQLRQSGQAFVPFYEAVEFRPEVDAVSRERLESALLDAGMLNALILADNAAAANLPPEMCGSVLFSQEAPLFADTLYTYLEPVPGNHGIAVPRIAAILSSILVDEDSYGSGSAPGACINIGAGMYRLGNLAGHAGAREQALYIGRQAREAYRRQQIAGKQAELEQLAVAEEQCHQAIEALQDQLETLQAARRDFPRAAAILELHMEEIACQKDLGRQQQKIDEKDAQKKAVVLELRAQHQQLLALRGTSRLELTVCACDQALQSMGEYQERLSELQLIQQTFASAWEMERQIKRDLEYLRQESDALRGELVGLEMELQRKEQRLAVLERQLQELDAAAVERRIHEIISRLRLVPQERDAAVARQTEAKNTAIRLQEDAIRWQRQQVLYTALANGWQRLLQQELARGFIFAAEPSRAELQALEKEWEKNGKPSEAVLMNKVTAQYVRDQGVLTEYRISFREIVTDPGPLPELAAEDQEIFGQAWQDLLDKTHRQVALAEADGRLLSPYQQRAWLKEHLDEQKNLLSEQDKRIYKEIIMNSIGKTISEKIYAAEEWVRKMNRLMQQSDTSSALRFHLDWKPVRSEQDAELDTKELVDLLHADPSVLKQEDMDKIVHHFQARINRAREEASTQERDVESFQTAVRELLDYRQWFQFCLYYDQGEQIRRRELTDRGFFRFSGGEKAMAMYIPLFSAAYSRYLEAGPDAPYIITLDEAFAGVDERNIRDMFKLVEELGFNYIMNSQALWGDYDVVPALNIYELLRPANASYVTVVPYHWDGHVRQAMLPGGAMEDDG
jgi:uncharacterized protein (TIGR02680 family)